MGYRYTRDLAAALPPDAVHIMTFQSDLQDALRSFQNVSAFLGVKFTARSRASVIQQWSSREYATIGLPEDYDARKALTPVVHKMFEEGAFEKVMAECARSFPPLQKRSKR